MANKIINQVPFSALEEDESSMATFLSSNEIACITFLFVNHYYTNLTPVICYTFIVSNCAHKIHLLTQQCSPMPPTSPLAAFLK